MTDMLLIQKMADSITEQESVYYKDHFLSIVKELNPNGLTLLKHLKKITDPNDPDEIAYEYQLNESVIAFFQFMEREFDGKNQDLRLAMTIKVLNDIVVKSIITQ